MATFSELLCQLSGLSTGTVEEHLCAALSNTGGSVSSSGRVLGIIRNDPSVIGRVIEAGRAAGITSPQAALLGRVLASPRVTGLVASQRTVGFVRCESTPLGFFEPERPPFYDSRLVTWMDADWPGDPGVADSGSDVASLASVPEDRSRYRLEALRGNPAAYEPPTYNAAAAGLGTAWEFDQTKPSGLPCLINGSVGESFGASPVEVGDTGPRWTICMTWRDDNFANNLQVKYLSRWNTPYMTSFWNGPSQYFLRLNSSALTTATVTVGNVPENRCFVGGVTSFGDGTNQCWINGFVGPRVDSGANHGLGSLLWMGGFSSQAASFVGGIGAMMSWDQAYDPVSDGIYDYWKRRKPGVWDFDNGAGLTP